MSNFIVSSHTLDLITQAAYKSKVVTKYGRSMFVQALARANWASQFTCYPGEYLSYVDAGDGVPSDTLIDDLRFTAFPRKFKRFAALGAINCWLNNSADGPGFTDSEVHRLVRIVGNKLAMACGYTARLQVEGGDHNATPLDVALLAMANMEWTWYDITAEQRDPESTDYAHSVMVRPIEVVRAERAVEAERIRAERMADAAAVVAEDDEDEDGDDWELDDDEY